MLPVVQVDCKTIDPELIAKVETFRDTNIPDGARVEFRQGKKSASRLGQSLQVDLTSKGGTIFTGDLWDVSYQTSKSHILQAKSKTFQFPTVEDPHTTMQDAVFLSTFQLLPDIDNKQRMEVQLIIKNSLETTRMLYELNWKKEIRHEGFKRRESVAPGGVFTGYISEVNRVYTPDAGPKVTLRLQSAKVLLVTKRDPNVNLPRRKH